MTNDQIPMTNDSLLLPSYWSLVLGHWSLTTMAESFILIPGRTSKQGVGISEGKFTAGYQSETQTLQVAPQDMKRLGLEVNDRVRLKSESGQIEVAVATA